MIPIILALVLAAQTANPKGEEILNQMANRYSSASGIQWTMQSSVYQPVFDETQKISVQFAFNSPDTFYYKSDAEEVIGIADTIWVLSKQHKQIQKRLTESYLMPTDFIIKWSQRYNLKDYQDKGNFNRFELAGKPGIKPANARLTLDKSNCIKEIFYQDESGNDVTFTISKERLKRATNIGSFYRNIPKGYKLIDLIE